MVVDISVKDLEYFYPSPRGEHGEPVPVLRGVNFDIQQGQFVALLGRVGAGKTTLCMALNGLVPHATGGIFRGNVQILGEDTRRKSVADLARSVGIVFQDAESQLVHMRVEDEVAFGPENLGVPREEIEERVSWALASVGLASYRDRSPLHLSGGEKQRVAIASMLAMQPQVLVLDEPTASLDPAAKAAVFAVLGDLARDRKITILMATQEMERIARFADRVLILHNGRIALDGDPAEVFRQVAKLQEWGLNVPQIAELGHMLSQRTGETYEFSSLSDAFKQLRRRARAIDMQKVRSAAPVVPTPAIRPLGERAQIEVDHVSYRYADGTHALRDVSFSLHTGEFVALIGPNGAGKTTLAKHLNGLLKPTSGSVHVEKMDTRQTRTAELARYVGYVFQNPDHQIFAPTVQDEIAFGPKMQNLPQNIIARRVADVLERFHLTALADQPPAVLGFGQRRQVALAAIVATQPQVLILDEPTGGLDGRSRQELLEVVARFNTMGRTIVLIAHDMRLIAEYATRAIVLRQGEIVFDDTPRVLFNRPEVLAEAHLALPPVTRLSNRLGEDGMATGMLTSAEFASAWQARLDERLSELKRKNREKRKKSHRPGEKG